jgi:hypothetical protein
MSDEIPQGTVADVSAPQVDATAAPTTDPVPQGSEVAEPVTKTFTQDELDAIVEKRLAKERRKLEQRHVRTLEGLVAKATPDAPQAQTDEAPKREAYKTEEDYALALVDYRAAAKAQQIIQDERRKEAEAKKRAEQQKVIESYQERVAKTAEKYEDYEDVAFNPELTITDAMAQVIQLSDDGPEIAYFLGKNPDEAKRIAALPAYLAAKELGKLEAKLSAAPAPTKQASKAPEPIKPVGGRDTSASSKPLDSDPIDVWVKKREAEIAKRNAARSRT